MGSYDAGKPEVIRWIHENFDRDSTILDVGACDGKWRALLNEYPNMDAVEIFPRNANRIARSYRNTFCTDIVNHKYCYYDLIIFGDVIEHMTVERAQQCLEYAKPRCKDLIIGVPWTYKQGPLYGNEYERHIQDDLTLELFNERYPGFEILHDIPTWNYCYFHKEQRNG